jgi:hypothetical protein
MREYMGILIAILLLGLLCTLSYFKRSSMESSLMESSSMETSLIKVNRCEGFHPDDRPVDFPDQSYNADLILAEKQIQQMLTVPSSKTPYLEDLLML